MIKITVALALVFLILGWSADWEPRWNPHVTWAVNRVQSSDFGAILSRLDFPAFGDRPGVEAPPSGAFPEHARDYESARVERVIDGDTIDVRLGGETMRVRYIGVNTPERDEACYQEAAAANRRLVEGQNVTLVRDVSETDPYGRLLRYVHVDGTFINEALVAQGFAEAVLYDPDYRHHNHLARLEESAAQAGIGCHPSGIFQDGSSLR